MIHIAIPARKGSKRIKNKNKILINGKPLIQYTLDFASSALQKELVNTASIISDDDYILDLAVKSSIDASYSRPIELSTDSTSTTDTLRHWINCKRFSASDMILLLQPTSPFRFMKDLQIITNRECSLSQMIYGVVLLPGHTSDYFSNSMTYLPDNDQQVYFTDGSYYYASVQRILSEKGLAVQEIDEFCLTSLPFPIDIDAPRDLDSLKFISPYELHD